MEDKISLNLSLPKSLYDEVADTAVLENRSKNKQVIHWIRLGQLLDKHPEIMPMLKLREQLQ